MTVPRDDSAFFGREREVAEILDRLQKTALVSIVGLGGVGKSRLALEVAARLERDARDVDFVRLDATTLEAAVRALAAALSVEIAAESRASDAVGVLGRALSKRGPNILVLDGIDALGDVASNLVDELLHHARDLRILVTARESLGAPGEEKLVLSPLDEDAAKALFRDRARTAGHGSDVDDADVVAIVRRVDALPLAIELAAARLEILSVAEVLARLDSSHGTMRATLDASWDVLNDVERSVLAQIAVFAAPFGIESAEDVVAVPEGSEVLDVLESLLRKSLLVRADGGSKRARLGMYETVRTWAREKLAVLPAEAEVHDRHARHHLELAEAWSARTYGAEGVVALDALTELLPELLAAFEWLDSRDDAAATRIVLSLTDLLLFRGLFELRAEVFTAGVRAAERAKDDRLLARALVASARVTLELGKIADAERELLRARDLARGAGDERTVAEAIRSLGWAWTAMAHLDEAEAALAEAATLHRAHGNSRGEADASVATGILRAFQGRMDDALAALQRALGIHVETGDTIRQEKVLGFASLIGLAAPDVARGLPRDVLSRAPVASLSALPAHVQEAASLHRDTAERWRSAIEHYARGVAEMERAKFGDAIGAFERALEGLKSAGISRGAGTIVAHAALAFAETGDFAEADARIAKAREAADAGPAIELLAAAVNVVREGESGAPKGDVRALLERTATLEGSPPEILVARRALERALAAKKPVRSERDVALVVGPESRWIEVPGSARIDLVRYGPVRRLLDTLVERRLSAPDEALTAEQLVDAGWPNERMQHTAGLLRVYSAVRRLRRLALADVLLTRDDGYLLDPRVEIERGT